MGCGDIVNEQDALPLCIRHGFKSHCNILCPFKFTKRGLRTGEARAPQQIVLLR